MTLSAVFFALCAIALVVVGVIERRRDPDATASEVFRRTLNDRTIRVAVLLIWWWLGWHFLAGQTL
ncbi:MAG: hypothetical protein KDB25_02360 [Leucobacter sp.]|nr:hypothetical protein [Leucobacter sp.]